jgi:hypothetical protein
MALFWDIISCSLADIDGISEKLTASVIRVMNYHEDGWSYNTRIKWKKKVFLVLNH